MKYSDTQKETNSSKKRYLRQNMDKEGLEAIELGKKKTAKILVEDKYELYGSLESSRDTDYRRFHTHLQVLFY